MTEPLNARVFHSIVNAAFEKRLLPQGFDADLHRRRWVRNEKTPIRELFELYSLKCNSAVPVWGFGLDFVPFVRREDEIYWRRTAKSSRMALWYDPLDYEPNVDEWSMAVFQSADSLRSNAERIAEKSVRQALLWFSKVKQVADLPSEFDEARLRPFVRFGFDNHPDQALAYAFTLAKLRRIREGRKWLTRYVQTLKFSKRGAKTLEELLLRIANEK